MPKPRLRDKDVWNLCNSIASLLADGLTRLSNMDHGYPGDTTPENWKWELNHHAEKFRAYGAEETGHEEPPYHSLLWFAYRFGHLWD